MSSRQVRMLHVIFAVDESVAPAQSESELVQLGKLIADNISGEPAEYLLYQGAYVVDDVLIDVNDPPIKPHDCARCTHDEAEHGGTMDNFGEGHCMFTIPGAVCGCESFVAVTE